MSVQRLFGGIIMSLLAGCGAPLMQVARTPGEHIDVPDEVALYSTDATPEGVIGGEGSERLAADVAAEIAKRGLTAVPDGALAATASWVLREVNDGHTLTQAPTEAAARRFGFAGVLLTMSGFGTGPEGNDAWKSPLAQVPPNLPITRYGVSVSKSGRSAAVVLGAVEISVEPIARRLQPKQSVTLRGEVAPRYSSAHVYLTKADGTVDEKRMPTRKIDASFTFPTAGKYNLEVMGDGEMGPVIVYNVPLYVGITPEEVTSSAGHATSLAEGEKRMLELLNQARKVAGVGLLQSDDELREIGFAHSKDMVEHHFFGHVSPTTGTTEDRYRRSGVIVGDFGENVAVADSAETAYDGLMGSPGHRQNMLRAAFTHVGIAAVETEDSQQLAFTMIFGRRVNEAVMPRTAAQVEAAFLALRASKGLSKPASDPIYRVAVEAGIEAYDEASKPSVEIAVKAQTIALDREVQRKHSSRAGGCAFVTEIIELSQLENAPILVAPQLKRYGIAARIRKDAHGPRLAVMMVLEGAPCR